jgi:hypothetical protein
MSIPNSSYVTGGLSQQGNSSNFLPLVTDGATSAINPTPTLNPNENPANANINNLGLSNTQQADLQSIATVRDPSGSIVVPSATGFVQLGDNYQMGFDPNTLQGRITPSLSPGGPDTLSLATQTYTGADVRLMIECAETASDGKRYCKQLLESTTISVSIHREVIPVRSGGYINPKGFALGKRTIAGTLIVTQFTVDVLLRFLQSILQIDGSKDSTYTKVDQLPPFNITMFFANEAGYASQRSLLGVKFVTDGVVYSIQDMMVEQTLSWMALDFTPLIPVTLTNLFKPSNPYDQTTRREASPMDLMQQSSGP